MLYFLITGTCWLVFVISIFYFGLICLFHLLKKWGNIFSARWITSSIFNRIMLLRNNTLRIINSSRSDEGSYVCRAENQFGSAELTTMLLVKGKRLSSTPSPHPVGPIPWLTTQEQTDCRQAESDGRRGHCSLSGMKMFVLATQESAHKSIYCLLGHLFLRRLFFTKKTDNY